MEMTVEVILQEIDIRIGKLEEMKKEGYEKNNFDLHSNAIIRLFEIESLKHWIKCNTANNEPQKGDSGMEEEKVTLTIREAAKLYGICENTFRQISRRPDFPKIQVGRRIIILKSLLTPYMQKLAKELQ